MSAGPLAPWTTSPHQACKGQGPSARIHVAYSCPLGATVDYLSPTQWVAPTHTRSFDLPFRCLDCPDNPDSRTFPENHLVSANCPDNPKLSRLSRNCALSGNIKNIPKNLETDRMAYLKEILLQVSAFGMPFLYCKFVQPILRTNLRYDEIGV